MPGFLRRLSNSEVVVTVRYPMIMGYCVALHLAFGLCLLIDGSAGNITALYDINTALGPSMLAVVLIVVALLAVVPVRWPQRGLLTMLYAMPQQAVLMMAASTALAAMVNSTFADGVVRPRAFIVADQIPVLLIATFHTLALIGSFWRPGWDRN